MANGIYNQAPTANPNNSQATNNQPQPEQQPSGWDQAQDIKPIGYYEALNNARPATLQEVGATDDVWFEEYAGSVYNGALEGMAALASAPAFARDLVVDAKDEESWIKAIDDSMEKLKQSDWYYKSYFKGQEDQMTMNPFDENFNKNYAAGQFGHFLGYVLPMIAGGSGVTAVGRSLG